MKARHGQILSNVIADQPRGPSDGIIGVGFLLLNHARDKVALMLRDEDKPIDYPGHWAICGGYTKAGETPRQAVVRQLFDEWQVDVTNFPDFKLFLVLRFDTPQTQSIQVVFYGVAAPEFDLRGIDLRQGQRLEWFSAKDLFDPELRFAWELQEIPLRLLESRW